MKKTLCKLKIILFGNPKSGSSTSSAAPESDFAPKPTKIGASIEIDEETPEPDSDGWIKVRGDRVRRIRFGTGTDNAECEDAPEPGRRRIRTINNPFRDKKPKW